MAKISLDYNKVYRAHDLSDLATLFFPQATAKQLRASFIALFVEIKNARGQKLSDTSYIADKYGLMQSSVCKTRAALRRVGLIEFRGGLWGFSSRFEKSLFNLLSKINSLKVPADSRKTREKENFFVALAKG